MTKYPKLIVLLIVGAAVLAVLFLPSLDPFSAAGDEDAGPGAEVEEASFLVAADPYSAFIQARENKKPIVLEFYARW